MSKLLTMTLVAVGLALLPLTSARAVEVLHGGTQVVYDGFEGIAPGGYPDANIWTITYPEYGGSIRVIDDTYAGPGAYEGNQYVELAGDVDPYITMNAHFAEADSGSVHAEWMMYIPGPGTL
jgi:hypothetical protein